MAGGETVKINATKMKTGSVRILILRHLEQNVIAGKMAHGGMTMRPIIDPKTSLLWL